MDNVGYLFAVIFLELLIVSQKGCLGTISCFVCSSRNGSNTACEDPFNAGASTYTERCKVPKRGHIGEFPAHFCIKLIGTSYATSEKIVVRRCVMETMDTQCGKFRLEDDLLRGCLLTCNMDGCNSSNFFFPCQSLILLCLFLSVSTIFLPTFSTLTKTLELELTDPNIKKSQLLLIPNKLYANLVQIQPSIRKQHEKIYNELATV